MTTLRDAADSAKNLAKTYKAVLDVATVLSNIADIDGATAEAEARRDRARVEAEDARQTLATLQGLAAEAEHKRNEAEKVAASIVIETREEAFRVIGEARDTVGKMLAKAQATVDDVNAGAAEFQKEHDARLVIFAQEEAEAQARVNALKAELAALKQRLNVE